MKTVYEPSMHGGTPQRTVSGTLVNTMAHKCHAENHESRHNTPNSRHNTTSSRHNTAETHGTTQPKLTAEVEFDRDIVSKETVCCVGGKVKH